MADTATELERLVVRLVGEGSDYERVLADAVRQTEEASHKIDQVTRQGMAANNHAMREAARLTDAVAKPTVRYANRLRELELHYAESRITGDVFRLSLRELNKEFGRGEFAVAAYGKKIEATGRRMRGMGMAATFAVTLGTAGMVAGFASFDDAMTKSLAIMGKVAPEMRRQMEQTARDISLNSVTSAKAAAEAYFFLASAGMNAAQSVAALPVVEKFAVAGAFDMSTATDLLTDAQSALGLSSKDVGKNMEGLLTVSDVLVKANTLANASVLQFSKSLTNEAGGAIRQYNMDLTEGVAILATYADQGIKGEEAGSMFGRMTRLLIQSINANKDAFTKLNIPVEEFAQTGKNVTAVIDGITKATEGMGPAAKAATLETLGFEARIQQAIIPLLGMTDKIRGYEEGLKSAGGITKEVAEYQLTSFSSQMKIAWNNIRAISDEIGQALAPAVAAIGKAIRWATEYFMGMSKEVRTLVAVVVGLAAAFGPLMIVLGTFLTIGGRALPLIWGLVKATYTWIAPLALIAGALALVVDLLSGGKLGFNDWLMSIRIGGTTLKTWLTATALFIQEKWEDAVLGIKVAWSDVQIALINSWAVLEGAWSKTIAFLERRWYDFKRIVNEVKEAPGSFFSNIWEGIKDPTGQNRFGWKAQLQGARDAAMGKPSVAPEADAEHAAAIASTDASLASSLAATEKWRSNAVADQYRWQRGLRFAFADTMNVLGDALTAVFNADPAKPHGTATPLEVKIPEIKIPEIKVPELNIETPKVEIPHLPKMDMPTLPEVGDERRQAEFKQVALNRISLAGLVGFPREKRQVVEAPGVEKRLDDIKAAFAVYHPYQSMAIQFTD